ncbi:MAG: L-serine ammonia-lyase, iron-sulfur-dependent, subunit alpha [Clostridia bacterium]|nr:L-serine ammonia-lyase, iron-sulfur-dependent, subunit alpha [Clostridia bacterium]NCC42746.1 L-serine ammonia-lyase, iron-sulfur-dependent, subunit alpha [Clostridia bacterium]
MDFNSAKSLLALCQEMNLPISSVMCQREQFLKEISKEECDQKMQKALDIMKNSVHESLDHPVKSVGGLIGGEAEKIQAHRHAGKAICGDVLHRAIVHSMAVLELNASMGLIVAAPTAGSAGVVPGLLLALAETYDFSDEKIIESLYTAGAVGYLLMRNASVAGAQAGCQAEVGSASAMAAAAAVELMGGKPEQCMDAATTALSNLLGLVCDPIAGLVESPCQSRNALGVANALTCAEIALSGVKQMIPFDEMADAMLRVGKRIPFELRETALGGCAATPTGCQKQCEIFN